MKLERRIVTPEYLAEIVTAVNNKEIYITEINYRDSPEEQPVPVFYSIGKYTPQEEKDHYEEVCEFFKEMATDKDFVCRRRPATEAEMLRYIMDMQDQIKPLKDIFE